MATFTNQTKNTSSFSYQSKNSATFTDQEKSDGLFYILTDALDYVLVGENEDEVLIWQEPATYTNQIKN